MNTARKHGPEPFKIAIIHGGPGAPGGINPVAEELSKDTGVLEPFQSASTLKGQVEELNMILSRYAKFPVTLIGWSWGAMLSFIFAAHYTRSIQKLILVSSAVFKDEYSLEIMNTRISHMNTVEKSEFADLVRQLYNPDCNNKNEVFAKIGILLMKTDTFMPFKWLDDVIEYQYEIYRSVWGYATKIRKSGELLELGKKIRCPVVAIHGDYDPHPAEGIEKPLSKILKDFRFILIEKCGHYPWIEKYAKEKFYTILRKELDSQESI